MTAKKFLPKVLAAPGVSKVMNLSVYPFGNAYYATEECGKGPYDPNERHCWFKRCIQTQPPLDDCFPADGMVAQHGPVERDINILESCAVTLNPDWNVYWPYIHCMEVKYSKKASNACAKRAGIDGQKIAACAAGPDGAAAEVVMAKATPDHPGVPWILVNGASADANNLLKAICEAYTGEKPEGCLKGDGAATDESIEILI